MRKQRMEAAQKVAQSLFEAENAIDEAIARAAELMASIPTARKNANLSGVFGQDALRSVSAVLPALAQAREDLVATHSHLDQAKTDMGLSHVAFGTPGGKPPQTILRAVDAAA